MIFEVDVEVRASWGVAAFTDTAIGFEGGEG
jgi:hypothetical protein